MVERAFEASSLTWDAKDPTINAAWRPNWSRLNVFFDFPPEIRKVIYTTNAIESLNFSVRKVLKSLEAFPPDDSALNDSTAASVRRSSK
ncbi:MAG: transposase [Nitrospira sp.]|nr:transposase [Nitrospira sp.]